MPNGQEVLFQKICFRKTSSRIPASRTTGPEKSPKNMSGQCRILKTAPVITRRTPRIIRKIESVFKIGYCYLEGCTCRSVVIFPSNLFVYRFEPLPKIFALDVGF